jgi:hypothetical protein
MAGLFSVLIGLVLALIAVLGCFVLTECPSLDAGLVIIIGVALVIFGLYVTIPILSVSVRS